MKIPSPEELSDLCDQVSTKIRAEVQNLDTITDSITTFVTQVTSAMQEFVSSIQKTVGDANEQGSKPD